MAGQNLDTHDWTGAQIVRNGEPASRREAGKTAFVVWRNEDNPVYYLITPERERPRLPDPFERLTWDYVKTVWESGGQRVGFSEAEAKRDFEGRGFHLLRIQGNAMTVVRDLA
jgi:hypothetical protein